MRRTYELATLLALAFLAGSASYAVSDVFKAKPSGDLTQSAESQQAAQQKQASEQAEPSVVEAARASRAREKTGKVWTNEELVSLRTPADIYLMEKAAQEEAAAKAAADKAAAQEADAAKPGEATVSLPATILETQKLIKDKQEQISDEQSNLDRMTKELPDAPEDQKPAMQKEIERMTADLPKAQNDLKQLTDHLEKLNNAQAQQAPPAPTPPNP
jgi:cell division protein FtsL